MNKERRKPKQERAKIMVQTILDACLICVGEGGFEGKTTVHIAERAGISVGTLYQYFSNKEEVYAALQERFVDEWKQFAKRQFDIIDLPFAVAIRRLLDRIIEEVNAGLSGRLVLMRELMRLDIADETREIEKITQELLLLYAVKHPSLGAVRDIRTLSFLLFNAGFYNIIRYLEEPLEGVSLDRFLDDIVVMLCAYIRTQLPEGADDRFLGI